MVERFNGRIADILKTTTLASSEDLRQTLRRYLFLYNYNLPQKALHAAPPIEALKRWHQAKPQMLQGETLQSCETRQLGIKYTTAGQVVTIEQQLSEFSGVFRFETIMEATIWRLLRGTFVLLTVLLRIASLKIELLPKRCLI